VSSAAQRGPAGWIPEAVLVAVTTGAGIFAGGRWIDPTGDPGSWWSLPTHLAEGERYYRDIPMQYGPLSPYLLALGVRVFGFSTAWVLFANWIPAILAGLLLLRLGRDLLGGVERLAVVGLAIGLGLLAPGPGRLVYPYNPPAVHALCLSLGALLFAGHIGGRRGFLWPGVLAGLAFSAKQEIGVAALGALVCMAAVGEGRKAGRSLAAAAGFAAGALPAVAFALWSAPLESLRQESHLWPLSGLPPAWSMLYSVAAGLRVEGWARRLAESVGAFLFCAATIAVLALLASGERRLRRLLPAAALLAAVLLASLADRVWIPARWSPVSLSMSACFVLAILALADRTCPGREKLAAFGLFSGLVATRAAFSADTGGPYAGVAHLCTALSWALLLFVVLPRRFPGGEEASTRARSFWLLATLPVAGMLAAVGIRSLAGAERVPVDSRIGRFWVAPRQAGFFAAMAAGLHPGERVAVLPECNAVDVIYGVSPAAPCVNFTPGTLDEPFERRLLARFRERPPDAFVLFDRPMPEYGVGPLGEGYGRELMGWIRANYQIASHAAAGEILRPSPALRSAGRYNPAP
jgi:Dolichyl-phosphate-mannose-protein mannosyltransferase